MDTHTATEIAEGLRRLADFIETNPDLADGRLYSHVDDYSTRYGDDERDRVLRSVALNPTRIDVDSPYHRLVWDFGGGVEFRRSVRPEFVAEQCETVTTSWRIRSLDDLRAEALQDAAS